MTDADANAATVPVVERRRRTAKNIDVDSRRDRRFLEGIQMTLNGGKRTSRVKNPLRKPQPNCTVESPEELIEKFSSMFLDNGTSAKDMSMFLFFSGWKAKKHSHSCLIPLQLLQ